MLKIFFIVSIFVAVCFGSEFAKYLQQYTKHYDQYHNNKALKFQAYKKAYQLALTQYKDDIKKYWDIVEISSAYRWIEYSRNYQNKIILDYKKNELEFQTITKNEKEASYQILKMFDKVANYNLNQVYMNDILEQKISINLDEVLQPPNSDQPFIWDVVSKTDLSILRAFIQHEKFKSYKHNKKFVFVSTLKLPKNFISNKKALYKDQISIESKLLNIPKSWIYAMIDIESYFNTFAIGKNMGFGLMQITPDPIGLEAYYYLKGEKKILDTRYLYIDKNNIELGAVYLSMLYKKTFQQIKNTKSRLYCTIAAYKIGIKQLSQIFAKSTNVKLAIDKINQLRDDQVYRKLLNKLPDFQTKEYFFKVIRKIKFYEKLSNVMVK